MNDFDGIDLAAEKRMEDALDIMEEMREKDIDDNEALYIVLRAAELGCEQKYIKHVAGMCCRDWPVKSNDLTEW